MGTGRLQDGFSIQCPSEGGWVHACAKGAGPRGLQSASFWLMHLEAASLKADDSRVLLPLGVIPFRTNHRAETEKP